MTQAITRNVYQATFNGGAIRYDVADNTVDASTIVDANFAYNFDLTGRTSLRLYFTVNNLFDEDPQAFYAVLGALNAGVNNGYVGDLRGRRYALGLSFDF
jgi:outer membrane receptor protein involved in Fe transport